MNDEELRSAARCYEVRVSPSQYGDGFKVFIPAFEAVGDHIITGGDDPEEALCNAYEAIELAIEVRLADGRPLPEPAIALPA